MGFPHGSRNSSLEPDRSQRVRFSSLPPSAPLFSFHVLEWTPVNSLVSHLYSKRASSLQRLANNASLTSTEEERRDPRDRVVFETSTGTWSCFRQLSCCGDVLILEDAESIDVGPPRRHEFTWQQGPGRLPSAEPSNTSFGASEGWRQALASTALSVTEMDAEAAKHGTFVSRPSHHRREIPLQDIHSIRRHCFKRPLPLTFNSSGHLIDSAQGEARGIRSKSSRHGSNAEDFDSLEWRYEVWGPVGVVFMLRGGAKLFLVFATGQHAKHMEELLIDFASGRGLQRQQRQSPATATPAAAASSLTTSAPFAAANSATHAPQNLLESVASGAGYSVGSPVSAGVPGSPAASYASLRLGSCEASAQGALGSPSLSPVNSLALPPASMTHASLSAAAGPGAVSPGTSAVSFGSPPLGQSLHASPVGVGPSGSTSVSGLASATSISATSSRTSTSLSLKAPGTGYLYCRPWGEAERHRRYYIRPASMAPTSSLVRMSRHRLPAWQKIRQTLGQEPRSVAMDLRQTYLTPSSTHENVFCVESVVDTFAQYKDVIPLGGAVATAGPGDEAPFMMAARRREMELCRSRPVVFEALAKSREERAEWLAWLQARGATVLRPEATNAPHMVATAKSGRPSSKAPQPTTAPFQPLGDNLIPTSPVGKSSVKDLARATSVDRWVSNCGVPSSSTDLSTTADPLGGVRQPQLPLRESDSERGSLSTSLRSKWPSGSPMRYPQPHPHALQLFPKPPVNPSRQSTNSPLTPDPVVTPAAARKPESGSDSEVRPRPSDDLGEGSLVVGEDVRDARQQVKQRIREQQRLQKQKPNGPAHREGKGGSLLPSPTTPPVGDPEPLDHTVKPSRRDVVSPQKMQVNLLSSGSTTHDGRRTLSSGSAALSAMGPAALRSPGEEAAITDRTLTGTGPTIVGAPHTPVYLEDTSSCDESPRFSSPSPSNTVAATSPHSATPSLHSPMTLGQREAEGDSARRRRRHVNVTNWSTPPSPHSTLTEKDGHLLHSGDARSRRKGDSALKNGGLVPHRGAAAHPLHHVAQAVEGESVLRGSTAYLLPLSQRPNASMYASEVVVGRATTPRATSASTTELPTDASPAPFLKNGEGATAKILHSRSTTAAPPVGEERGVRSPASDENCSQDRLSASQSLSPSPNAPCGAAPQNALLAASAPQQTGEMTLAKKLLFAPSERDDDGAQARDVAHCSPTAVSSAVLVPVHSSSSSASSANGLQRNAKSKIKEGDVSGEWSGWRTGPETLTSNSYRASPDSKLDPRLSQFFFQAPHDDSDLEDRGESVLGTPLSARVVPLPSESKFGSGSRSHGNDSFARSSASKRRLRDSPLPLAMPPRTGSLASTSHHDTPVDSGLRERTPLTLLTDRNGNGVAETSVLHSGASSRAMYRDSEHLVSPLGLESRKLMEQRKRAFRDSLFVNQE